MTRSRSRLRVAALLLSSFPISACGDGPSGPVPPIEALPRSLSVAEEQVIAGSNAFAVALLRQVLEHDDGPNIVLSPFSASMALGMALNGAAGETFEAMRTALRFGTLSQGEINAAYRGLVDLLLGLDRSVKLSVANSTWAREGTPFHASFHDSVSTYFDAVVETRDFDDPRTVDEINRWAEAHTDGYIDRILQALDDDDVMVLLNAIYFEGRWTTAFDPDDTGPAFFTRPDGSTIPVDMMHLRDVELPMGVSGGLHAVELPYGGGAWSMVVAVPSGVPVRDVVKDMDSDAWNELVSSLSLQDVDEVAIPKFTLNYDVYLNEPLKAMGMEVAFDTRADFSNLSPDGQAMCIGFVRQKSFIEVDEAGTKAAAVTAVGIELRSFSGLIADRPFLFAIRESLSGTILFTGIVEDPTVEDSGPTQVADDCY